MADPLRRTLLAKLRGKKSKKGATVGGGYGSAAAAAAAAANGGREGKEKVLQTQRDSDEARPVVLLATERMSTYENCVDGAMVRAGGVVVVRESRAAESAGARPQERSSGGRARVNEELLGVSLQRAGQFGGHAVGREGDGSHRGPRSGGKIALSPGVTLAGPHVQRKHFVSVPRQCSVGDSIGFGDNSNHVLYRAQVEPQGKPAEGPVSTADDRGQPRHMAEAAPEHNANWSLNNNQSLEADPPVCAAHVHLTCASGSTEENILIRNVESYEPEYAGDTRGTAGALQSPTFFPTELEIRDINMASLCATGGPLRYTLDSEDEDYYDNEILPFYETVRTKSDDDRAEVAELPQPGQDKGQLSDSNSAQETDRLRSQLKEAYYLLINAMNDINLDVQQISGGFTEQQASSSCSSHSRDSLCSRLSAKNMDSDSWSSGGDHSPQQVSDTDSLLLCLSGNPESGVKDSRVISKSMLNLSLTGMRPALLRSASDGAIRYPGGPSLCAQASGAQGPDVSGELGATGTKEGRELTGPRVPYEAVSSDEMLQDAGGDEGRGGQLNESSGSINSLTGSSDSNGDASAHQGHDREQELAEARALRANSVNKGHGVTVNKMQEWMHKGRLLSSEMKQRIEGSSLPRGGGQSQDRSCPQANPGGCKPGAQTSGRGVKSVKAKSPAVKSPGRKATRSGPSSRGSSKSETSHPPSSSRLIILSSSSTHSKLRLVAVHPALLLFWMQSKGTSLLRPLCFPFFKIL